MKVAIKSELDTDVLNVLNVPNTVFVKYFV